MSKAILVMDMPDSCDMCDMITMVNGKMYCGVNGCGKCAEDYVVCRPSWCPLREVPQKRDTKYSPTRNPYITEGYNACIDKILEGEV